MKAFNIPKTLFITSIIVGVILRLFSMQWNEYPHQDVMQEVLTASQFLDTYTLTLPHPGYKIDISKNLPNQEPFSDKPPLIVISAAIISKLLHTSPYFAAQLISLASGLISIPIIFSLISKYDLTNKNNAYMFTSIWTLTYFVIDYSSNGARYMLQTTLLLSAIYLILNRKAIWILSLISAALFLNNYQIAPVIAFYYAYILIFKIYSPKEIILSSGLATILISPIFIYYFQHFGKIFYTTHYRYLAAKQGIENATTLTWENPFFIMHQNIPNSVIMIKYFRERILFDAIKNVIYTAKQFFEFIPIYPLIGYLFIKNIKKINMLSKHNHVLNLTIISFFIYGITIMLYPHVKMRHFLTLYALSILLASYIITFLKEKTQNIIQYLFFLFTAIMVVITYNRNPYHTFYAGGVVHEDQFRLRSELLFMDEIKKIESMSKYVPKDGAVATSFDRAYFIPNNVLYTTPFVAPNYQEVIDEYQLKYLWMGEKIPENLYDQYPLIQLIKELNGEYLYKL